LIAALPKARLVEETLRAATAVGFRVNTRLFATPAALPVIVAAWRVLTGETMALNPAVLAPAFTVMELGTWTAPLLLVMDTIICAGAAAVR
jgi:hypothetical protein